MYSDWDRRSEIEAGETEDFNADILGGHRDLALREPLTQLTTGIVDTSMVSGLSNDYFKIRAQLLISRTTRDIYFRNNQLATFERRLWQSRRLRGSCG